MKYLSCRLSNFKSALHTVCIISNRVFSRAAVIPFNKVSKKQTLQKCLELQSRLKKVLQSVKKSAGVLLELGSSFTNMENDGLFREILEAVQEEEDGLDMQTQYNKKNIRYSLLGPAWKSEIKTMMHLFELSSVIHYTSVRYCLLPRNL